MTLSLVYRSTIGRRLTVSEGDGNIRILGNSVFVSVKNHGAMGDGVTDDATALQAAFNTSSAVYIPEGTYLIGSALTQSDHQWIEGAGRFKTTLLKGFNGDLLAGSSGGKISNLTIDGDGATYTGRGVTYGATTPLATIEDARIIDCSSYCLEFTAAGAGSQFTMRNCEVYRTTLSTEAIKLPSDGGNSRPRKFFGIETSGGNLMDLDGANNVFIQGCVMTNITFRDDCNKVYFVGNRVGSSGDTTTVLGTDNVVVGNAFAGNVELGTSTIRCVVRSNVFAAGFKVVDSSGSTGSNANWVDIERTNYAVSWTAATDNPAIGNGSLTSYYTRNGRDVFLSVNMISASSTTFGNGVWSFSLPFAPTTEQPYYGTCRMFDTGTNTRVGVVFTLTDGTSRCQIEADSAANVNTSSIPFTWASGDRCSFALTYSM